MPDTVVGARHSVRTKSSSCSHGAYALVVTHRKSSHVRCIVCLGMINTTEKNKEGNEDEVLRREEVVTLWKSGKAPLIK